LASWDSLSGNQRAAVLFEDGPAAVYAGPGSGKTRVVTLRAARMAEQGKKLLVTTFTSDATQEMKTRIGQILTKSTMANVHVTTMHALCLQILRGEGLKFGLLTDEFLRRNLAETAQAAELEGGVGGFLSKVSFNKNTGATAATYQHDGSSEDRDFARAWRAFEKAKAEKDLREFDDLIQSVIALFKQDSALRSRIAARYSHIVVDECQDMNAPQYVVAFALGQEHKNLMLVGDLDQSLYGFRGADTRTFQRFAAHPSSKVFELRENYRCTRSILTFADSLIRQDTERRTLVFTPTRSEGEPVVWQRYADVDVEALAVGEEIQRLVQRGVKYQEIAVLYRANAQSEALERNFAALEIPYTMREDGDFYARKEVQGLLGYLNFFAGTPTTVPASEPIRKAGTKGSAPVKAAKPAEPYPDEWFLALMNVPNRKINRMTGSHLRNHAEIRGKRIWDILPEFQSADLKTHRALRALRDDLAKIEAQLQTIMHAGDAVRIIRKVTDFDGWLRRDSGDDRDNDRIQNMQRMQAAAAHYPTIADYLAAVQKVRDEAARRKAERAKKRRQQDEVTLATGHSAKGLEWRVVFAIGWSEDLLPHRKADDINEERRIAYVIATRARDLLFLSSPDSWNEATVAPSRFLTGLNLVAREPLEEGEMSEEALPDLAAEPDTADAFGGLFMEV
jgi:DNA helicase-2/ATP-dependent DNA helicase PcrA